MRDEKEASAGERDKRTACSGGKECGHECAWKTGRLIRTLGSFYTVREESGKETVVRCPKKIRHQKLTPLVGDLVRFSGNGQGSSGWIEEILPRKTVCLRPPAANVSLLLIVVAPVPEPDLLLVDKQAERALAQGMRVAVVVNKCDLDAAMPDRIAAEYERSGIPVLGVSAMNRTGLDDLRDMMRGEICCMSGQSGAGKSSLLCALTGARAETGGLSEKIQRGRNTTRKTELYEENGLYLIDSAGFSLLEAEKGLEPERLKERYPEFAPYENQCRFRGCLHDREPGCAVQEALNRGELPGGRVERYRLLLKEVREEWRERYD